MDRELELFLLSTIASTFTTIGTALSRYLERQVNKRVQEEPKNVPALSTEVKAQEPTVNNVEKPEPKQVEAEPTNAPRDAETKKEESKTEAPKHKTTIVEVRKIMMELSRKGKGKVIQDVLSNDFNVTKLSDVKEDDYDDFVTRVLYYAGETDEFVEVDNA